LGSAVFSVAQNASKSSRADFSNLLSLKIAKNGKSKFEPQKQIYPPKSPKRQNKNRAVVKMSNFFGPILSLKTSQTSSKR
jgi:hypothetical protein